MGTYKFKQYNFGGTWLPDADPTLIGEENFSELVNLRYTDTGLELVYGMSKLTTVAEDTDIISVYTKSLPTKTVVLCQIANGDLYQMDLQPGSNITSKPSSNTLLYSFGSTDKVTYEDGPNGDIIINHPTLGLFVYNPDRLDLSGLYEAGSISSFNDSCINIIDLFQSGKTYYQATPKPMFLVFPRPVSAIYFDIASATASSASSITINTFTASGLSDNIVTTDNTAALTTSGTVVVSSPATIEPIYYDGYEQYFYKVTYTGTSATGTNTVTFRNIYAVDKVNKIVSLWDGTALNPILARIKKSGVYSDYTLEVNYASAKGEVIGMPVGGMTVKDTIELGFSQPVTGITFAQVENKYNTVNTVGLTLTNSGTSGTFLVPAVITGTSAAFSRSSIDTSFYLSEHKKTTVAGKSVFLYVFTLTGSGTITANTTIDVISGAARPTQVDFKGLSTVTNGRIFITKNNDNLVEFSYPGISNVWQGKSSSDFGNYNIKVGDKTPPIALKGITNIYDGGVASSTLIMKRDKTYVLTGDSPENFKLYLISEKYGCAALNTIQQVRFTFATTQGPKNALIWISAAGPVISDGSVVLPLGGINKFFDIKNITPQADASTGLNLNNICVNMKRLNEATSYYDPSYDEYNVILPQGTFTTSLDPVTTLWLAYSNKYNKWYQKKPNNCLYPTSFTATSTVNGKQYVYGVSTYTADSTNLNKIANADFSSASVIMNPGTEYSNVNFNNWSETYGSTTKSKYNSTANYNLEFTNKADVTVYNNSTTTFVSDKFLIKPDVGYSITANVGAACIDDRVTKSASTTTANIIYYDSSDTVISTYELGSASSNTNTATYVNASSWYAKDFSFTYTGIVFVDYYSYYPNTWIWLRTLADTQSAFTMKYSYMESATGIKHKWAFTYIYSEIIPKSSGNLTITVLGNPTEVSPVQLAQKVIPPVDDWTPFEIEFPVYNNISNIGIVINSPSFLSSEGEERACVLAFKDGILYKKRQTIDSPITASTINTFIDKIGGAAPAIPAGTVKAAIQTIASTTTGPTSNPSNFIGGIKVSEQASATANKYIYSLGNVGDNTWDGTSITGEIQTGDLMLENTPWLDTKLRNLMMFADYPEQVRVKVEYTNDQEVKTVVTDQEFTNLPLRINKYVIDMNKSSWTHRIKFYITGVYAKLLGWGLKYSTERETE